MIRSRGLVFVGVVGIAGMIGALQVPQCAEACAAVSSEQTVVKIADETAVIIWDPLHGVEHFVRKAIFKTKAKDFGFLVPTPATPDLAEAKDELFWVLDRLTIVRHRHLSLGCSASHDESVTESSSMPVVEVLKSQRVGGLDAVVLAANDAGALTDWLRSHGYSARPALNEWLSAYVAARWKVTAFKIAANAGPGDGVVSTVVRMSFPCIKPYFPYREPADQRQDASTQTSPLQQETSNQQENPSARALRMQRESSGQPTGASQRAERLLRIYFFSDGPMEGKMDGGDEWPGQRIWSRPVQEDQRNSLARSLSLQPDHLPSKMWLTVFEDHSSPRPGTVDVYFQPASPEHSHPFPETDDDTAHARYIDATGILLMLGMIFLYLRSRRHKRGLAGDDAGRTRLLDRRER